MKYFLWVLLFDLLVGAPLFAAHAPRPNVIVVLFDDLGYGQPKCYRKESEFKTPNIDRLAAEGVRFTDAHSAASVCTPTRYGLLTGRYPFRIGQYGVLTTYSPPLIPSTRLTVASLLKQNGYDTACIGKWHLGMDWPEERSSDRIIPIGTRLKTSPNAVGFDHFVGFTHARNIGTVIEQDKVIDNVEDVENQPLLTKRTLEYLEDPARKDKPFFLYLPLGPPHTPVVPAPEFAGRSGLSGKEANYGDWLYQGDWILGQVLAALERQRLADNTLVIVSSDNGAAGRSYPPLRAAKSSIYEGGHRVPLLARWPGRIKAGSVCDDTICLNDLMATCAEIVGAKLPHDAGEDSVSILPSLLGTAHEPTREATVHQAPSGDLAIRKGPWKLILFKSGERELYNLNKDLGETTSVADANPDIVARLTKSMEDYVAAGRSTPGLSLRNDVPVELSTPKARKSKRPRRGPVQQDGR